MNNQLELSFQELLEKAQENYNNIFPKTTFFERAIFFSWGCTIGDCTFCYMSTQPSDKKPTETKRSFASLFAEAILCKKLGWEIGFFTGGIGVFTPDEMEFMLKIINHILGEKIWLSIGPVAKPLLERFKPYIKGVVGSTETINPELHKKVCPSKPLQPYEKMFLTAKELDLERAMTFIVGMGETHADLELLKNFIEKYGITKVHVYGLIPITGTMFEGKEPPTPEEQAWWIAQLRITFPRLDIQCGIWKDRSERIPLLLHAGANSLSKFPATKEFGSSYAHAIENACATAGRTFIGTLTKLPDCDWKAEIERLDLSPELKKEMFIKLNNYLVKMKRGGEHKCLVQIQ